MAIPLFDLVGRIIVTGTDQFNRSMVQAEVAATSFVGKLDNMGKSAQQTGMVLTRNLTVPLAIVGGAVIKFGADFEKAMDRSLSIVDNMTPELRRQFESLAMTLSGKTTFSAKEVAEAFYYLAGAGLDANQMLASMETAAIFAEAGHLELKDATEQLTDVLGAFGLASEDATQYMTNMKMASDLIAKANSFADATISQFTEALMKCGGTMSFMGQSINETIAVLAAFSRTGLKGVDAGEAMIIMAKDLAKSASTAAPEWERLGISVYDASGNMRPIGKILEDLKGKLRGMSTEQALATLKSLDFQQKSIQFIQRGMQVADTIQGMRDKLKDYSGYAAGEAARATQGFWDQLKMLGNQAQNVAIILYQVLGPTLKYGVIPMFSAMVQILRWVAQGFSALPAPVTALVAGFIGILAAIGPLYLAWGGLCRIAAFFIPIIGSVVSALGVFFAICASNPLFVLAMALSALVVVGYNLIRAYGSIGNAWAAIWDGMKRVANKACMDLIDSISKTIEATLREFKLLGKLPFVGAGINKAMDDAIAGVERLRKKFDGFFSETKSQAKAFGTSFSSSVNAGFQKVSTSGGAGKAETNQVKQNAQESYNARVKFENDWNQKSFQLTHGRLANLRMERDQALAEARKLGASRLSIMKYYAAQERALQQERIMELVSTTQTAVNNIMSAWSDYTSARIAQIDTNSQREIKAIQDSNMSEEEKARKIREIENKTDAQKRDLQRKQAVREKALAIFNAVINAAVAYVKALTLGPIIGWIMAGLIAASAGVQIALIAAKPIPFAKGGLIKGGGGGVNALMGEGQDDELVLPMGAGISALVDALIEEVNKKPLPRLSKLMSSMDEMHAMTGGIKYNSGGQESVRAESPATVYGGGINHWNIGVLVANDAGIKELERRQQKFRIAENQRRGHLS
jgi:TP901 family phage tail tape measure protein